jgi:hypothetical protein
MYFAFILLQLCSDNFKFVVGMFLLSFLLNSANIVYYVVRRSDFLPLSTSECLLFFLFRRYNTPFLFQTCMLILPFSTKRSWYVCFILDYLFLFYFIIHFQIVCFLISRAILDLLILFLFFSFRMSVCHYLMQFLLMEILSWLPACMYSLPSTNTTFTSYLSLKYFGAVFHSSNHFLLSS